MELRQRDELVMKLIHFFITKYGYNPVVVHGAANEVWLENLNADYKIIRVVSKYIHNDEQMMNDLYKTIRVSGTIKKKTYSRKMPVLAIFTEVGENVTIEEADNVKILMVKNITDITKNELITSNFPNIIDITKEEKKGVELFEKLSSEINEKSLKDTKENENIFTNNKPVVTYTLIAINILIFLISLIEGDGSIFQNYAIGKYHIFNLGEYYRLFTAAFLHGGLVHLLFNCYALYIIGPQVENFYKRRNFLLIYFGSILSASLLSSLLLPYNGASVGASGAIFGLLGALLYFGYHYRLYLGNALNSQLIPLIFANLLFGMLMSGIDNAAHIGGLIGGILVSMAVGVSSKSTKVDKINGIILYFIFVTFMMYLIISKGGI